MKTLFSSLVIGALGTLKLGLFNAAADLEVSASVAIHAKSDFHAPLAAHGVWLEVGSYGRCWRPASIAVGWRPYSYGNWVWTDCGWYWVSDEPWAWACYHYGWWVYDPNHAWIWVPGIEWAPAWVSWRVGGGYCGWAPLAPHGVVVASSSFVFVEAHRLREPVRPATLIVNNTRIVNQTKVINNIKSETKTFAGTGPRKVMINEGPGVEVIQKGAAKQISAVPIGQAVRQTPVPDLAGKEKVSPRKDQAPAVPGVTPGPPAKPNPPDNGRPPSKSELTPPFPSEAPSGKAPGSRGTKEGKGHDKGKP
jgi:hypothetical protein